MISEELSRVIQVASAAVGGAWSTWQIVRAVSRSHDNPKLAPPLDYCWRDEPGGMFGCRCRECMEEYKQIESENVSANERNKEEFMKSDEYRRDMKEHMREQSLLARPRSVTLL